eukprot:108613-Chlamydomonas_euryale.AAC.7
MRDDTQLRVLHCCFCAVVGPVSQGLNSSRVATLMEIQLVCKIAAFAPCHRSQSVQQDILWSVLSFALPHAGIGFQVCDNQGHMLLELRQGRSFLSMLPLIFPELDGDWTAGLAAVTVTRSDYELSGIMLGLQQHFILPDHELLYINGRPCSSALVTSIIHQQFKHAIGRQLQATGFQNPSHVLPDISKLFPGFVLQLSCPAGKYSINSEPDKTIVTFSDVTIVAHLLGEMVFRFWGGPSARSNLVTGDNHVSNRQNDEQQLTSKPVGFLVSKLQSRRASLATLHNPATEASSDAPHPCDKPSRTHFDEPVRLQHNSGQWCSNMHDKPHHSTCTSNHSTGLDSPELPPLQFGNTLELVECKLPPCQEASHPSLSVSTHSQSLQTQTGSHVSDGKADPSLIDGSRRRDQKSGYSPATRSVACQTTFNNDCKLWHKTSAVAPLKSPSMQECHVALSSIQDQPCRPASAPPILMHNDFHRSGMPLHVGEVTFSDDTSSPSGAPPSPKRARICITDGDRSSSTSPLAYDAADNAFYERLNACSNNDNSATCNSFKRHVFASSQTQLRLRQLLRRPATTASDQEHESNINITDVQDQVAERNDGFVQSWSNPAMLQREQAVQVLSVEELQKKATRQAAIRWLACSDPHGKAKHAAEQPESMSACGNLVPAEINKSMCDSVLVIADQHAVDERIRYEQLTAAVLAALPLPASGPRSSPSHSGDILSSVQLKDPQIMSADGNEAAAWHEYINVVQRWGWSLKAFLVARDPCGNKDVGTSTCPKYALTHVPCVLGVQLNSMDMRVSSQLMAPIRALNCNQNMPHLMNDNVSYMMPNTRVPPGMQLFLSQLAETRGADNVPEAVVRVLKSKACRSAVMFGDVLPKSACIGLIDALRRTKLWSSCAHGRPTLAPIVSLPCFEGLIQSLA